MSIQCLKSMGSLKDIFCFKTIYGFFGGSFQDFTMKIRAKVKEYKNKYAIPHYSN